MRTNSPKKDKYVYRLISTEPYKTEKIKNPMYDPKYKVPKKPNYCKNKITENCLMNDCYHLAIGAVDEKSYIKIKKCLDKRG